MCLTPWKPLTVQAATSPLTRQTFAILEALFGTLAKHHPGCSLEACRLKENTKIFEDAKITHGLLYTNSTKTHIFKPPFPTDMGMTGSVPGLESKMILMKPKFWSLEL